MVDESNQAYHERWNPTQRTWHNVCNGSNYKINFFNLVLPITAISLPSWVVSDCINQVILTLLDLRTLQRTSLSYPTTSTFSTYGNLTTFANRFVTAHEAYRSFRNSRWADPYQVPGSAEEFRRISRDVAILGNVKQFCDNSQKAANYKKYLFDHNNQSRVTYSLTRLLFF